MPAENIGASDWYVLADWVARDPHLGASPDCERRGAICSALFDAMEKPGFPKDHVEPSIGADHSCRPTITAAAMARLSGRHPRPGGRLEHAVH